MTSRKSRPFIVPVFLPQAGCPRQCVFCDQNGITASRTDPVDTKAIVREIDRFLSFRAPDRSPVQISFYGGNFLGLDPECIRQLLRLGDRYVQSGRCDHLRFSTRPDTISSRSLDLLASYPVDTIEIGVQSLDDRVLDLCRRGHTAADALDALALLKKRKYRTGVQLMTGLPGQSGERAVEDARIVASRAPDFVRIYPLLVMAGSPLARWYRQGRYRPDSLEEAVAVVGRMVTLLEKSGIPVIRTGLQITAEMIRDKRVLAGPLHPAFGHLVRCDLMRQRAETLLAGEHAGTDGIQLRVHPRNLSHIRGHRGETLPLLKERFHLSSLSIVADEKVALGDLRIRCREDAAAPGGRGTDALMGRRMDCSQVAGKLTAKRR